MDLRNRYLIVGALLTFLGVQAWLVHQNETRYRASEDISLVKSDLLRSKSENERMTIEISNLRAEIEQLRKDGKQIGASTINEDQNLMVLQAAALERCEKQLKKLQNENDKEDEVPSIDPLHQEIPDTPKEYPEVDINEESLRLHYSGDNLPAMLNPPANNPATLPTSVALSCDTAWLAPRVMHSIRFFDIFAMNWETEIGLVSQNKVGGNLMCRFEIEGTVKLTPIMEVSTGYLRAALAHCEIPSEAKKFLQENNYVDFEIYDSVAKTSEPVSVCIPEEKKFYYLANCCIYRNDDNIIDQWLQWQINMGLEHFFLYDHKSTDLSNKILAKYVKEGRVTYMNWRNNRPEPHNIDTYHVAQDAAYLSCTNRFRDRAKWIWTGDTDEFLYTPNEDSVIPILKKYEDNNYLAGVRAIGYRMSDNPDQPLPLIPDPKGETMLIEPYRLNMTFPEKYQYRSTVYTTFKVFVKVKEALYSSIHELAGGGSSIDLSPSDVSFMHFRFERYGRQDSPNDRLVYDPNPYKKFGKKIKLRYAQDMV